LQVKEPLAIETVKNVLHSRYKSPTELLIKKIFEELHHSVDYDDKSNTFKGIMWQYFVIGRLIDFKNKTVFDFVNESMTTNHICQIGLKKQLSILNHMEIYKCYFGLMKH
jgi:hypothetical protein